MANKTHCDVCDATPAVNEVQKQVALTKPRWDRNALLVKVEVWGARYASHKSEPEPFGQKDICDSCRAKLVADAFGLRTADEYNALRDQITSLQMALDNGQTTVIIPEAEPAASDDIQF